MLIKKRQKEDVEDRQMKHMQTYWNWYYCSVHKDMRFKHPMGYVQYEIVTKLNNYKQNIKVAMPIQDLPEHNIWKRKTIDHTQLGELPCPSIYLLIRQSITMFQRECQFRRTYVCSNPFQWMWSSWQNLKKNETSLQIIRFCLS